MIKKLLNLKIGQQGVNDMAAIGGLPLYLTVMFIALLGGFRGLFWQLFAGIFFTYLVLVIIRSIYFKARPDHQRYSNFLEKLDASSFPSLHAMRSTVLSFILAALFNNPLITLLLVAVVFGVSWARVLERRHYWKDVMAGILLGLVIGVISVAIY